MQTSLLEGLLSPMREHQVILRQISLEKFQKVPEHFRHPLRRSMRVPKPFWLDGLLRNNFLVSPKLFRFSLRNFFVVSETFLISFSQIPCLVLSRYMTLKCVTL